MKNKVPKFFCESCGSEVKAETKVCQHCGKFFASVRCPACGVSGTAAEFTNGCPMCGYALSTDQDSSQKSTLSTKGHKKRKSSTMPADPLPAWVYLVSTALFVFILLLFVFHLRGV